MRPTSAVVVVGGKLRLEVLVETMGELRYTRVIESPNQMASAQYLDMYSYTSSQPISTSTSALWGQITIQKTLRTVLLLVTSDRDGTSPSGNPNLVITLPS